MRVLVVEDHAKLAMTLATGLRQAGMAVDVVFDGQDALDHLAVTAYDVVVLDRDIPGVHGDDVCKALVAEGSPSRVLMLTAAGSVEDRVEGLGIGADDYLPKPCDFTELVARIRALVRRPGASLPPTLSYGDLQLDPVASDRHQSRPRSCRSTPRSSPSWRCSWPRPASWCPPKRSSSASGTRHADPFSQAVRTTISRLRRQARRPASDRDGGQGRLPDRRLTRGAAPTAPRPGPRSPPAPAERTLSPDRALLLSVLPLGRRARRHHLRPDRRGPAPCRPSGPSSRSRTPEDFDSRRIDHRWVAPAPHGGSTSHSSTWRR